MAMRREALLADPGEMSPYTFVDYEGEGRLFSKAVYYFDSEDALRRFLQKRHYGRLQAKSRGARGQTLAVRQTSDVMTDAVKTQRRRSEPQLPAQSITDRAKKQRQSKMRK